MSQHSPMIEKGWIGLCLMLVMPTTPAAEELLVSGYENPRIYRTREEQREAGLHREITPWLSLSGLLEGEIQSNRFIPRNGESAIKTRERNATLQLGLNVDLFDMAEVEAVVEYDTETDKFLSEEAFITFEYEQIDLSLGKQFTPLGLYFSRFVTGPMLEFAETSARNSGLLTYGPSDQFDLTVAAYRGRSSEQGEGEVWDWAVGFEAWPSDAFSFGLSYQSDLSDSDARLLDDNHYIRRVPAVSAYLLGIIDGFELSFEVVAALDEFQELEEDWNKPMAWNAEAAHYIPSADIDLAIRIEESRELKEEPELRYGAAVTWYPGRQVSLTMEYLRGRYDTGAFVIEREEEVPIEHVNTMSAKLTMEF